jgi:hypothetical protein
MIDFVRELRAHFPSADSLFERDMRLGQRRFDHREGVIAPDGWRKELRRLDSLPLHWRVSVSDKVASGAIDNYRRHALEEDDDLLAPVAATSLQGEAKAARLTVRNAIKDIARLIEIAIRREDQRGRPRLPPPVSLRDARLLRGELTRRFQAAQAESGSSYLYGIEIKVAIENELSGWPPGRQKELLMQLIKSGDMRPSTVAARIAAIKFAVPLRQVRRETVRSLPRRRPVVHAVPFEEAERRNAAQRRGHHPRR